jgi:hypothetical protein
MANSPVTRGRRTICRRYQVLSWLASELGRPISFAECQVVCKLLDSSKERGKIRSLNRLKERMLTEEWQSFYPLLDLHKLEESLRRAESARVTMFRKHVAKLNTPVRELTQNRQDSMRQLWMNRMRNFVVPVGYEPVPGPAFDEMWLVNE